MIVTGEASGDLHGAKLMSAITAQLPDTKFFGVGGKNMAAKGCEILIPGEELAVMGIVEIVGHLPVILNAFNKLKREFYGSNKPDALVLIDFPEFNLRLARQAKKAGIPVLYYVSPQVWAWRRGRVKKIAAVVDSLAAIFPFEPAFYDGQDILVKYVGHPLLDEFEEAGNCQNLRPRLQIAQNKKVVGLFPGSRHNELRYMLDTLVESAQLIFDKEPEAHFLVPVANTLSRADIQSRFPTELPVSFIESDDATIYDVASSCDTILTVSGTVTLQIALVGTPMAIFYKVSPLTYSIGKRLINVDHAGLANIVAGARIVPEFIQDMATPQNLADEALRVLSDSRYASDMRSALENVHTKLGEPGCSARVAEMLLQLL
jgi:lipid-A-disaccharide synthase